MSEAEDKRRAEELIADLANNPNQETIGNVSHFLRRAVHAWYTFYNGYTQAMEKMDKQAQELAEAQREKQLYFDLWTSVCKQRDGARALLDLVLADEENRTDLTLPEIRQQIRAFLAKGEPQS